MFVTIPLTKEQLSKAIDRQRSLAKADLDMGCPCPKQYQDQGLSYAGDLVGWIPDHFGGTLKLGYNKLVFSGPRDMSHVIKYTILEICDGFWEPVVFKDNEFKGVFSAFEYYVGTSEAVRSSQFRDRMSYQTVLPIVQDMWSGKSPINPETIMVLEDFVEGLPSYPKPGTAAYARVAATGDSGGFRKNDFLKRLMVDLKSRIAPMNEAEEPI